MAEASMRVVITQPTYLPWLGYFELLAKADSFVFLDNVQYERRSWQNRNRLKGFDGAPFWLTVPVESQCRNTALNEIRISFSKLDWRESHLRSIRSHLGAAPYFDPIFPLVEAWLLTGHELLVDLTISGIKMIAEMFGLRPTFIRASELGVVGRRADLLLRICERLGADHYYSALGSKAYLAEEESRFVEKGIAVEYQSWIHPVYSQRGEHFASHLSALDAVMNIGPDLARELLSTVDSMETGR